MYVRIVTEITNKTLVFQDIFLFCFNDNSPSSSKIVFSGSMFVIMKLNPLNVSSKTVYENLESLYISFVKTVDDSCDKRQT